jgi:hypothetical protein
MLLRLQGLIASISPCLSVACQIYKEEKIQDDVSRLDTDGWLGQVKVDEIIHQVVKHVAILCTVRKWRLPGLVVPDRMYPITLIHIWLLYCSCSKVV